MLASTQGLGGTQTSLGSSGNEQVGICRRDIEDFRYSCLGEGDRALLDELRPAYAQLVAQGWGVARVPENTPIAGRRPPHPKRRRQAGRNRRHSERRGSRLEYRHHHRIPGDDHEDDYDDDYDEEGDYCDDFDGDYADDLGGGERGGAGDVTRSSVPRLPGLPGQRDAGPRGVANRHHLTTEPATPASTTVLPKIGDHLGQAASANGQVDRLEVRPEVGQVNRRQSNETGRILSSTRGYGRDSPSTRNFSGPGSPGNAAGGVANAREAGLNRSSFGVDGSGRNASFAESSSRQHTRDGYYSRQNSRITDSRRGLPNGGVVDESSRRVRRKPNAGGSPSGGAAVGADNVISKLKPRDTTPLADMSFWQRLELFKAAQRRAYTDALGYAQLYKPRPSDTWMFGHRIHRAFVFSYFGGAEQKADQTNGATAPGQETTGKKKKKKRRKGGGKGNEMKSIFGSVLPQDFYPGGKMNIDGKYTCDYNQISV